MELVLMDYRGKKETFNIGDLNNIARISLSIKSGDEEVEVIYKDYEVSTFSTFFGFEEYFDGGYELYNFKKTDNLLNDPEWLARKSSSEGFEIFGNHYIAKAAKAYITPIEESTLYL